MCYDVTQAAPFPLAFSQDFMHGVGPPLIRAQLRSLLTCPWLRSCITGLCNVSLRLSSRTNARSLTKACNKHTSEIGRVQVTKKVSDLQYTVQALPLLVMCTLIGDHHATSVTRLEPLCTKPGRYVSFATGLWPGLGYLGM